MNVTRLALLLVGMLALAVGMRRSTWQPPESAAPYLDLLSEQERKYGMPPDLLVRLAYQESRFRDDIISGRTQSGAGAVGIMQIVPKWHPEIGEAGARDPKIAIKYGAKYLWELFSRFGTWPLALAAYNWGQGNVSTALRTGRAFTAWPQETQNYVRQIAGDVGISTEGLA